MSRKEEVREGLNLYMEMMEKESLDRIEESDWKKDIKIRLMMGIILFLLAFSAILSCTILMANFR